MEALNGDGGCGTCDNIARVEIAKKTSAYMNVWMYVIREMEDAIMDCQQGCIDCNDDPVHAWDEAVAFYTGSLEGAPGNQRPRLRRRLDRVPGVAGAGKMLYALADKRCRNFA